MDRLITGERGFQHRNVQVRLTIEIWDFLGTGSIVVGVVEPFLCFGTTAYCLRLFHRRNFGSFRRAWVRRIGDLENRRSRALGQHLELHAVERLSLPSLLDEWSLRGPLFPPIEHPRALGKGVKVSLFGFLEGHPCFQRNRTGSERIRRSSRREGLKQIKGMGYC